MTEPRHTVRRVRQVLNGIRYLLESDAGDSEEAPAVLHCGIAMRLIQRGFTAMATMLSLLSANGVRGGCECPIQERCR